MGAMGADPIATMRPAIVEVIEKSRGDAVWCATFEVAGGEARFVQFTPGTLNVAYPPIDPPERVVAGHERLATLVVQDWKPHQYAVFELPEGASPTDIAHLADAVFRTILGCTDGYPIVARVECMD